MNDKLNDDALRISVEQLRAELNALRASTSWKITVPLRFVGRLIISGKKILRQVTTSPRTFVKHCFSATLLWLIPLMKRSALIRRWAKRLRQQYPNALGAFVQSVHPQPIATNDHATGSRLEVNSDIAFAWSTTVSPVEHFTNRLNLELKRRQIKINGQQ
jgi:hypothetical protein